MQNQSPSGAVVVTPTPRNPSNDTATSIPEVVMEVSTSPETSFDELVTTLVIENKHYGRPKNYLNLESCKTGVNENWRRRLCEWMYEVTDHYKFDRQVVSVAFDYLDRSVSLSYGPAGPNRDKRLSKRDYQLYAVTSLYLAMKLHGEIEIDQNFASDASCQRAKLPIAHFTELSRGFFEIEAIEAKEREMLSLFDWKVNPPTSSNFIVMFLHLLPELEVTECSVRGDVANQVFDVAKYLTELSIFVSDFSFSHKPSLIAYSAIVCALDYIEAQSSANGLLSGYLHARFLCNMNKVSNEFNPGSEDVQFAQLMLKKLAPNMFTITKTIGLLPRSSSLLEVDNAIDFYEDSEFVNYSRAISPVSNLSEGSRESGKTGSRKNKRQKV